MKQPTKKQQQALIAALTINARTDAMKAINQHLAAKNSIEASGVFTFPVNNAVTTTVKGFGNKKYALKSEATETALVALSCVTMPLTRFGQTQSPLKNEGQLDAYLEYDLNATILRASDAAGVIEEDVSDLTISPAFAEQFLQQPIQALAKQLNKTVGKEANEIAQRINGNLPEVICSAVFVREKDEDGIESDYPLMKLRIGWE